MIRIHNFPRGLRGQRAAWQCEEMGLAYELIPVTFPPSAAYLALNPIGNVPFLEDEGGVAIGESVAIMLYLAQRHGPTPLLPARDDPALARVLHLTVFGEASIGAGMNPLMAAHFGAPAEDKRNWSVRMGESRVEGFLAYAGAALGEGPYFCGGTLTLADISISTALGIWRGALGKTLPDGLAAYQDRIAALPTYQKARERVVAGT
jgi:glutathione S-transferase